MKVSLICVYNNQEQLDKELGASLDNQDFSFEKIFVDNTNREFSSAASALNWGAKQSTGDILVFSHQDIWLKEESTLYEFALQIDKAEVGSVVGTQGVREKSKVYYQNLTAGDILEKKCHDSYPDELIEVSCFDEGFFGMKRETWELHNFDEKLCDSWHLYAVEACLYARKNGHKAYVFPSQIHHFSYGRISIHYMNGMKRLCKFYRKDFKYIWTTCYKVRTNPIYMNCLVLAWTLNRKLRGRSLE